MRYVLAIVVVLAAAPATWAEPFVHGPYSGAPSQDSVAISWLTSQPMPARVEYATREHFAASGQFTDVLQVPLGESSDSLPVTVVLEPLAADTDFAYRVVLESPSGDVASEPGYFATAPSPGRPVSFAILSDTQWQWEGENRLQAVGDAMAADATSFDFILHAGDLVESPTTSYWNHWFASFDAMLLRAPLLPVLGNHERNHRSYYDHFTFPPGGGKRDERWWALHWGDVVVVGLDTDVTQATDYIAQQAWAREHLSGPEPHKFVMFHYPVYSSDAFHGSGYSLDKIFHPIFVESGVDLVISGHAHNYERIHRDGITYLVVGGGGAVPRDLAAAVVDGSAVAVTGYNFYLRVTADSAGIHVEAVKVAEAAESRFALVPDAGLLDEFSLPTGPLPSEHELWRLGLVVIGLFAAVVLGILVLRGR